MTTANVLTSLGAADLDTKQLVSDLVNAVKEPRQKQIDEGKKKAEVAVSSLGLLKSALSNLQAAATELGSVGKLNKLSISNSNAGVVVAESGNSKVALPGNHSVVVSQLAQPKRIASAGYAESTSVVSASGFTLTLDKAINVPAGTTVSGLVSAINASGSAITARLVNTGSGATPYKIVLEGASGANNNFTATSSISKTLTSVATTGATKIVVPDTDGIVVGGVVTGTGIPPNTTVTAIDAATKEITLSQATTADTAGSYSFNPFASTLQSAQDAAFTLNGVAMTRSNNIITDALDGVTLKLNSVSATPVQLGVSFNSADIAASAKRFVDAYNVLTEFIDTATGPAQEDNDFAGTLQNDSSVRGLKASLRAKLIAKSSSFSGNATHWSVLGVALDRSGVLQFDETKFKTSFEKNPTDVVKALSNNATEPYIYSGSPSGLAGDMAIATFGMVRSTGVLADVQRSYESKLTRLETQQTKLDKQIESITNRYERQFSALNAVLAEFKATQKRLENTFNNNKD